MHTAQAVRMARDEESERAAQQVATAVANERVLAMARLDEALEEDYQGNGLSERLAEQRDMMRRITLPFFYRIRVARRILDKGGGRSSRKVSKLTQSRVPPRLLLPSFY